VAIAYGTRRKLWTIFIVGCCGLVIGPLFANLVFGLAGFRVVKGMIAGVVITATSAAVESFVFDTALRRVSFLSAVLLRSLFYIVLITLTTTMVVAVHESMVRHEDVFSVIHGEAFQEFLRTDFVVILGFAAAASFAINFVWQMNRLLGRGVLVNYVTGRYHTPRQEERVFMFLDLKSSTTIAEEIDPRKFHMLLNDCFHDLNEPILRSRGEICQYIGDEVVITWKMKDALRNARCLQCFFLICDRLREGTEHYQRTYGVVPEFKAGIHCGTVVVGEVGDARKEIVFHGDVMNTTARIQSQCNALGQQLLVSRDLVSQLPAGHPFRLDPMGAISLKGKLRDVELFGVHAPTPVDEVPPGSP
jgi:adenylate cyclase